MNLQRDTAPPGDRLLWRVGAGPRPQLLDIRPSFLGRHVAVFLDDQKIGDLDKPDRRHPWSTFEFEAGAHRYTVALTLGVASFGVEVFCDGLSLVNGRTVVAAERDAPRPISGYASWTGVNISGVSSSQLAPRWVRISGFASVIMLAVSFGLLRSYPVGAVPFSVGGFGLLFMFLRTWIIATARTHRYLLSRPEMDDVRRLASLALVFAGIPIVSGLLLGAAYAVASSLR